MSRKNLVLAIAALALLALGGLGYVLFQRFHGGQAPAPQQAAAPAPAPIATGQVPAPVFLVMDKGGVIRYSKAGLDIARQMEPAVKQIEASLNARREALERDVQQLQGDTGVTGAEREKRIAALTARQNAINADAQNKQAQLQAALATANAELSKAVSDIIPGIVKSHGANLVLEASVLPKADPNLDITGEVIKALDQKLTAIKLNLGTAAPGAQKN